MPQAVNFFVDITVFFYVCIRVRDVSLWLVVVKITDKIMEEAKTLRSINKKLRPKAARQESPISTWSLEILPDK